MDDDTRNYLDVMDRVYNGATHHDRAQAADQLIELDAQMFGQQAASPAQVDADAKAAAAWDEYQADLDADRQAATLPDPQQATHEELAVADYLRDQLAFGGSTRDREVE